MLTNRRPLLVPKWEYIWVILSLSVIACCVYHFGESWKKALSSEIEGTLHFSLINYVSIDHLSIYNCLIMFESLAYTLQGDNSFKNGQEKHGDQLGIGAASTVENQQQH